jgi:integrase/recombinase XerD
VTRAAQTRASLREKRITLHVLRHSAAMRLLHAGVDTSVIALWLGHEQVETTQIYLHADPTLKERALARTTPVHAKPGRYQPSDAVVPSLRRCDYADMQGAIAASARAQTLEIGIIRRSA